MTRRHSWSAVREVLRPATWAALSPNGRRAITEGTATVRVQTCTRCGVGRERLLSRRPVVTRFLEPDL